MTDSFVRYHLNLRQLVERLGPNHPRLTDALVLQARLTENMDEATRYGPSETNRADRMRILEQLNNLAIATCDVPFFQLYPINEGLTDSESETGRASELDLIYIEAGCFIMGSILGVDPDAKNDEHPIHSVYIQDYAITRTTITNAQYALFVNDTNYRPPSHWTKGQFARGKGDHPVVNVSLVDALAYCDWMKQLFKQPFTLPSEAEWEKAARGEHALTYPWGYDWKDFYANTKELGRRDTIPVHELAIGQSKYGLLHMSGNVFEWTRTIWGADDEGPEFSYPYRHNDGREDLQAKNDIYRIVRGGAFNTSAKSARTTARTRYKANTCRPDIGFRIVTYAPS